MHGFRNNYFSFHLCSKMFQFLVKIRLLRATKGIKNGQLLFLLCTAVQISEQAIVRKAKTNKFHRSSDDNEAIFLPIFRKILTRLVAIFPKRNYFIEGKVKTLHYEIKLKGENLFIGTQKMAGFQIFISIKI